ncbi:MAG: hypothetical protein CFE21_04095 [Bacteroidetes bacterium B1(2017)]|nr:MAG: hypothetical protein CFE21_04095 [Bacteroidetes bacterium B1(2017)]
MKNIAGLAILMCVCLNLFAQEAELGSDTLLVQHPKDTIPQRDIMDMMLRMRYTNNEITGLDSSDKSKTHFALVPAAGYSLQTGFAVIIAANTVFNTGKPSTTKASSIFTCVSFTQYHQLIVPFIASVWTPNNTYQFVSDNRYLKYPSLTFGTGPDALTNKGYAIEYYYLKLHETLMRRIVPNVYAGVGYYYDYFWDIREKQNTRHRGVPEPIPFVLNKEEKAAGWVAKVNYDTRPRLINPSKGFYASVLLRHNPKWLGSTSKWSSGLVELRKFFTLPGRAKNVLAFWSYNWFTVAGTPTYLMLPSTGWDDYFNSGRGYIQGRFRGKDMVYLESEYRFKILRSGLLGGVLFANAQYFTGSPERSNSVWAPGGGVGLRLKVNKLSATNLAIDYGFGLNGSQGFFVNLGEAF